MLILAFKPGHDGAIAAIKDRELLFSLEAEKDSFPRYSLLNPTTVLSAVEMLGELPDVIGVGGWFKRAFVAADIGAGYFGADAVTERETRIGGKRVKVYSGSHVRSHIWMSPGMAPPDDGGQRAVLVWEGMEGSFYVLDEQWQVIKHVPVLPQVGDRYALIFALADPGFPADARHVRLGDSGKLMALAAFADPADATPDVVEAVDRMLRLGNQRPAKKDFEDLPIYNAGVEAEVTKLAAALITKRIFDLFAEAATKDIPPGLPLYISGGCGLNCDWNAAWRELGHFSSVFVPPCTNDSGSALGTGIDALFAETGDPSIEWDVYSGLDFVHDRDPDPNLWARRDV